MTDERLNKVYQQIALIEYSDWAKGNKWQVLSDKALNVVCKKKLSNIFTGGSVVKSLFEWLIIERSIEELRKEYKNE